MRHNKQHLSRPLWSYIIIGVVVAGIAIAAAILLPGERERAIFAQNSRFPDFRKVMCPNSFNGCACHGSPENLTGTPVLRLRHAQSVIALRETTKMVQVRRDGKTCWYPRIRLRKMPYAPVLDAPIRRSLDHSPLPLSRLVPGAGDGAEGARKLRESSRLVPLGYHWPTFYHLALENFHPGPMVPVRTPRGKVIGRASKKFLKQVRWQGSGITRTGLRLHWAGRPGRFNAYPRSMWGHGAGYNYRVFPYRTIAVHFRGWCRKLSKQLGSCRAPKRKVIGLMVYIPEIAKRKPAMPGGGTHDGFFCATDTGSPYYIRSDRIDMFVGVHGGGNPYLPEPRRRNFLYDAGIKALLPADWRLWRANGKRVFCPLGRLPRDIHNPRPGDCLHDYHYQARDRALSIYALFDKRGRPVRCRKRP